MFQIPINDERIQSLTREQIDFMLYADIADDPEKLSKLENYFYDPEFDEEFDKVDKQDNSEKMDELGFKFKPSAQVVSSDKTTQELDDDNFFDDDFMEV
jgi:hypothetical protein